jgi:hypothetical protein
MIGLFASSPRHDDARRDDHRYRRREEFKEKLHLGGSIGLYATQREI